MPRDSTCDPLFCRQVDADHLERESLDANAMLTFAAAQTGDEGLLREAASMDTSALRYSGMSTATMSGETSSSIRR